MGKRRPRLEGQRDPVAKQRCFARGSGFQVSQLLAHSGDRDSHTGWIKFQGVTSPELGSMLREDQLLRDRVLDLTDRLPKCRLERLRRKGSLADLEVFGGTHQRAARAARSAPPRRPFSCTGTTPCRVQSVSRACREATRPPKPATPIAGRANAVNLPDH